MQSNNEKRPMSPHLTIYRPQFTSVLSILHRITGLGLLVGLLLVALWFLSVSLGESYFTFYNKIMLSWPVKLVLIASTWGIWYHTCAGIRHLFWDMGIGLETKYINISAWGVLALSAVLFATTLFFSWDA